MEETEKEDGYSIMKNLFYMAAIALLATLSACSGKVKTEKALNIDGQWEFSGYATKSVKIGDVPFSVYLEFNSSNFKTYEKRGEGRYRKYEGTFTITDGVLDGKYSDGTPLHSKYKITKGDNSLTLETDKETYTYKSSTIPVEVIADAI